MTTLVRKLIQDFPQKYYKQIWGSLLLAITVFFSAPLSVFLINQNTLEFTFKDALPIYLGYTLLAFVSLAAISIAVKIFWRYLVVIYVALSLGFVIQGNYLLYDLGKMDGHTIEWSTFYRFIPFELLVWVGLIVAAIIFRKKLYKNFMFAAGLVFLLGIFPVVGQIASRGISSSAAVHKQYFDYSKQFEFSNEKNVVVIVLDTFRSDAFEEILQENPEYAEDFKDFTFFTNAAAGYPTTKPSLPLILTGNFHDNTQPFNTFIAENQANSLPTFLLEHGINIEGYFFTSPFIASWQNLTYQMPKDAIKTEVNKQLFVTYLRYLPLPIKPFFVNQYYSGEDYFHKNVVDFYESIRQTTVRNKPPVFKFIHLSGVHSPYQLNESFDRVDEGYLEQAKATLKAVVKLLSELKTSGAYDNSLVIVLGDHGTNEPLHPGDELRNDMDSSSLYRPDGLLLKAEPLLLAKQINEQNDRMVETSVPVSIADTPKTVAEALGLENNYYGYSIFEEIPQNRVRKYYYYQWKHLDWNSDYLPELYEYEISGDISDPNAWEFQNKVYTKEGVINVDYPAYFYGTNMVLSILANGADRFFAPGFEQVGNPEEGVWSVSTLSCIYFQPKLTNKSLTLSIDGYPFLYTGKLESQRVVITLDQEEVAKLEASPRMQITLPAEAVERYTSDNKVQLCFGFPDAHSPKQLGASEDRRLLGYRFTNLAFYENQPLTLPLEIQFTKSNTSAVAQLTGFSLPEENFTWTNGKSASIQLSLPKTKNDVIFEFLANPFLVPGNLDSQRVIIRVNGQEIQQLELHQEQEVSVTIPAEALTDAWRIEFDLPDADSPFQHGISEDKRQLGLAFKWVRIREK